VSLGELGALCCCSVVELAVVEAVDLSSSLLVVVAAAAAAEVPLAEDDLPLSSFLLARVLVRRRGGMVLDVCGSGVFDSV